MTHPRKNISARRRRRKSNERWLRRKSELERAETYLERYVRERDIMGDVLLAARVIDRHIPGMLGLALKGLGVL